MSKSARDTLLANTPLRILFVENNATVSELCKVHLKEAGFDISHQNVARNQQHLRAHISSKSYDIVLMEELAGSRTTTDVFRLLRQHALDTPVVLLVDPGRDSTAIEYIEQGAWDVLAKDQLSRLGMTAHRVLLERKRRVEWSRMERETDLARRVTHDINSLVTVVIGSCDDLARELGRDNRVRALVEEIRTAAELSASLAGHLLFPDGPRPGLPTVLDLNGVLSNMEAVLRRLLGGRIELQIARAAQPLMVKARSGQIEQLVLNLSQNAGEAMTRGGQLTIQTESVRQGESSCTWEGALDSRRYVRLAVTDTGCGMDGKTQARIFEPFFTTKKASDGRVRGLGLAVVHAITKQWGGLIRVQSQPGSGTTFEVYLPQVQATSPEPDAPAAKNLPRRPSGSRATVLLVEDEPLLRQVVCRALKSFGHRVVEAHDATEAVRITEQGRSIDLLVTDVAMPSMSGPELAQRLKSLQPRMKVLFMTGHTASVVPDATTDRGKWVLQKPFKPSMLADRVREILGTNTKGTKPIIRQLPRGEASRA